MCEINCSGGCPECAPEDHDETLTVGIHRRRAEVVKLIKKQMEHDRGLEKGGCWHYGTQELRELLDFIYNQEPRTKDEELEA